MKLQRLLSLTRQAVDDYRLIQSGDKIAIGISGGKDSLTLLYALQGLRRFYPEPFELCAITVDLGFQALSPEVSNRLSPTLSSDAAAFDLKPVQELCDELNVPYTVVPTEIGKILFEIRQESNPCALCAKMRKGALNEAALKLGCNKIALGHHYDDVIETILMGMLYGGQVQTMMPKLHSTNFEGMELIRPMYLIRENEIKRWRDYNDLHFIQCACKFTDTCTSCNPDNASKRQEIKNMIKQMSKINPQVESNIFKSVENVNLDTVIAFKKDGVKHNFLEKYKNKEKE